jgi:(p)ppGpp synthase/HD superfamily hydrolase
MSTLERAIEIAAHAHTGQVDKAGEPYILHPLRVMLGVSTPDEQIVAVLHDIIEDTGITSGDLGAEGFSDQVVEAVITLTKVKGQTYEQYIAGLAHHPLARIVKLADLDDNSNISRIPNPTDRDLERLEKYRRTRRLIEKVIGKESG